jgi:hypothetical protein
MIVRPVEAPDKRCSGGLLRSPTANTLLAWPALFLSLGWNFLEYGVDPPDGSANVVWGWLFCGVLFVLMGGLPLLFGISAALHGRESRASRARASLVNRSSSFGAVANSSAWSMPCSVY